MTPDFLQELDRLIAAPAQPEGTSETAARPYLDAVKDLLNAKYAVLLAYMAYGDQLTTVDRDGLYKHFQEHIDEERSWIYQLHRTLAAQGAAHVPTGVVVPPVELRRAQPMLAVLLALEETALRGWEVLATVAETQKDRLALSGFAQEGARIELTHIEDLRRWLGGVS